jgi:hypothetical protein
LRPARWRSDDRLLSPTFLLRSLWSSLVLFLLLFFFLFPQLLLFVLFLVLLATLVSHACSFSAIMPQSRLLCERMFGVFNSALRAHCDGGTFRVLRHDE